MTQVPGPMPMMMPGMMPGAPAASKFTPVDPIRLVRQYKWLLIGSVAVGITLGLVTYYLMLKYNPQYTSVANIAISGELPDPYNPNGASSSQESSDYYKMTQAVIISSPDNLRDVLRRPEVQKTTWFHQFVDAQGNIDYDSALRQLDDAISVSPITKTQLISISAKAATPDDAQTLANGVVDTYVDYVTRTSKVERTGLEQVFSTRRNRLLDDISTLRGRAASIMDDAQLAATQTNFNEVDAIYQNLITQQQAVTQQLTTAQQILDAAQKAAQSGTTEFTAEEKAAVDDDPVIRNVDARIMGLREERRVATEHFGPNHRVVQDIDFRIAAAQAEREQKRQELLAQLQDVKLSTAKSQVAALQNAYASVQKQLVDVRTRRKELNSQLTLYSSTQDDIKKLESQLQDLDSSLTAISIYRDRPDAVRVTPQGRARRPQGLSSPKMQTVVPGITILIVGLMAGLLYLKEMLDSRIKSPSDVKLLPKADLLGVIPHASEDPSGSQEIDLVVAHQPTGLLAENFRQLRTEVMNRMQKRRFRTLMVAGCEPSGGATAVTLNLACSLAFNDRRVLVVDANFRRPAVHSRFKLDKGPGLGDLMTGKAEIDAAVRATDVNNLDVITIGDADGHILESLESDTFTQLLRKLEDRYELILIDAPPMSIVGDSRLLANRMDAVMLVVRALQEKRGLVSRVMNQLGNSRAEFMGLVLNGVRSSAGGYFRRNYQQFYEYQKAGASGGRQATAAGR